MKTGLRDGDFFSESYKKISEIILHNADLLILL